MQPFTYCLWIRKCATLYARFFPFHASSNLHEVCMAIGNSVQQDQEQSFRPVTTQKVVPVDTSIELPRPTRDMEQIKADLARAGYAIMLDVLKPAEVREFRQVLVDEIAREEALDENRVRRFYTDPDDKNRRLSRLPNRHRWFRDVLEHPVALQLTRHILGPT